MKKFVVLFYIILTSCGVKGQRKNIPLIQKDTICFDLNNFKLSMMGENEYIPMDYDDRTYGIFFKTKQVHQDLNLKRIVSYPQFVHETSKQETVSKDKSLEGNLFYRLNQKVIVFADTSNSSIKYLEMDVGLFSLD